ncbi:DUF1516 family protein [Paenibacillus senegalensis]|uniref:DUF1516 family protein n=1 Tax=Paenibacillus senegalensis TaxID=1465766 RepID=UPI000287E5D1|nr:DUF1516 family protein [Paenibacillus senegalensis]
MDSERLFNIFYQIHAGSWAILVIFFLLTCFLRKQKVTGMITRLFYVLMLVSGAGMLYMLGFPMMYVIKGILAVALIAFMEMIQGRLRRGEPTLIHWVVMVILLALIVLMGFGVIAF